MNPRTQLSIEIIISGFGIVSLSIIFVLWSQTAFEVAVALATVYLTSFIAPWVLASRHQNRVEYLRGESDR